MGNRSFLSFFFPLLMFVIFGAISCFATSESLYLTFDGAFPRFIWVAIVIGFYIITSLGTKWIIESFSSGTRKTVNKEMNILYFTRQELKSQMT